MRVALILSIFLLTTTANAGEYLGRVCFGENLAKPIVEHGPDLLIQIDEMEPIQFNQNRNVPFEVVYWLNLTKPHQVKVYFGGEVVAVLNWHYVELGTDTVIIWRSAGSWEIKAVVNIEDDCPRA